MRNDHLALGADVGLSNLSDERRIERWRSRRGRPLQRAGVVLLLHEPIIQIVKVNVKSINEARNG